MTLQTSGAISLGNVQTEFGGSNPISFSEYYAGGTYVPSGTSGTNGAVPSSGAISMSKFYGTSAAIFAFIRDQSQHPVNNIQPVCRDSSGNLYFASAGSPGPSSTYGVYLKFNASGSLQWAKYDNGFIPQYVAGDSSGNIYAHNAAFEVMKISNTGAIAWQKKHTLPTSSQVGPIAVDSSGNVYATSLYHNGSTDWRVDIVKYNSAGTYQASKYISISGYTQIGPKSAYADANYLYISCVGAAGVPVVLRVALDLSSAISYRAGVYGGSGEFMPVISDSNGSIIHTSFISGTEVVAIKTNSSGNGITWQKKYTLSSALGEVKSIGVDASDNIYLFGDAGIIKTDSSGTSLWGRTFVTTSTFDTLYGKLINGTMVIGSAGSNYFTTTYTTDGQGGGKTVVDHYEYGDSYYANLPTDGSKTGTYLTSTIVYSSATVTTTTPSYSLTTQTTTLTSRTPTITTPSYTLSTLTMGTLTAVTV